MLYLLYNTKKQAPWQIDYENLYTKYLSVPFKVLNDRSNLDKLTENDILWIQHFSDIDTPETRRCKSRKMAQVNGTSVNQYIGAVDKKQESVEYNKILDIALVFDSVMADTMKKVYPSVDFWPVGFPIPKPEFLGREKKKQICVAGRLDVFKNVNLDIWLTENLRKDGYKLVICYPDKDVQAEKVSLFKPGNLENVEFRRCNKDEWLDVAQDSEFYLLASLDDVGSVSIWEAYYAGCYILVPNIANGIIRYPDYINPIFEAFNRRGVEQLVKMKPRQTVDTDNIEPDKCVRRLEKYLNEKSL